MQTIIKILLFLQPPHRSNYIPSGENWRTYNRLIKCRRIPHLHPDFPIDKKNFHSIQNNRFDLHELLRILLQE